jgi:hypothetical protein
MRLPIWTSFVAVAVLLVASSPLTAATLSDIHRDKLPQDEAVQQALDRIMPIEELVDHWSGAWKFSVPKDQVQTEVSMSLSVLQHAAKNAPQNEDLQLAIALLAHYAYNVDVDGVESQMTQALNAAHALAPSDYRSTWFLANSQCQDLEATKGMKTLEELEAEKPWQEFPISFWDDYIACSIVTNVPSHGLRAFDRVKELYPSMVEPRERMKEILDKRTDDPSLDAKYVAKQIWEAKPEESRVQFTAYACGMRFNVQGTDQINLPDVQGGHCTAIVNTGPYKGKKKKMSPSVVVMCYVAKSGETLEDFQKSMSLSRTFEEMQPPVCKWDHCIASKSVQTNVYKDEGDSYVQMEVFERSMPKYPGLLFEEPYLPSSEKDAKQIAYFHADERLLRFPVRLFYVVEMESSTSVVEAGKADYLSFLQSLEVE